MHHGGTKDVPLWATALVLAEKGWGHPDDVMRRTGGVVWAHRQALLDEARERSRKMNEQKQKN